MNNYKATINKINNNTISDKRGLGIYLVEGRVQSKKIPPILFELLTII